MIVRTLSWLGRQGTRAVAAGIFLGTALPQLASFLRPWLAVTVFIILLVTLVRVDLAQMRLLARKPGILLISTGLMMIVIPVLAGYGLHVTGLWRAYPELSLGLMIMAAAPPLVSAPALIYMIGLDGPLALASLLLCILVTPLTVPVMMALYAPSDLAVSPAALAVQLFAMIAGGIAMAYTIRRVAGEARIAASSDIIDAIGIIGLVIFAISFMDGVGAALIADPVLILSLIALAFLVAVLFIVSFAALLWWRGKPMALTLGIINGNRSVGLVVAAMAGAVPDLTWIYCAVAQFPIYLLPQIIKTIAKRMDIVA